MRIVTCPTCFVLFCIPEEAIHKDGRGEYFDCTCCYEVVYVLGNELDITVKDKD